MIRVYGARRIMAIPWTWGIMVSWAKGRVKGMGMGARCKWHEWPP